MADTYTAIDLSKLPKPAVIELLSFEAILAEMTAKLLGFFPEFDITKESDPSVKILQIAAYRELLLRQRVNDAAYAVMLPYAKGDDLKQLGALMNLEKFVLTPADPETGTPVVEEEDDDFRRRIQLAPEGFSVAGPRGAYVFHALSADADVLDADAYSPDICEALITVLSRTGDGEAPEDTLEAVRARLSESTDLRPMTDHVTVQSAEIVDYNIVAVLYTYAGPTPAIVLAEALTRLNKYVAAMHRLGLDVTRSGITAALHVDGVQRVVITSPAADVAITRFQASHCTGIDVTHGGVAA